MPEDSSRDYSAVTLRPWEGPCATTGLTMQEFAERINDLHVPEWVSRAAVSVCRAFGVGGWSDLGYVAHTIAAAFERGDSRASKPEPEMVPSFPDGTLIPNRIRSVDRHGLLQRKLDIINAVNASCWRVYEPDKLLVGERDFLNAGAMLLQQAQEAADAQASAAAAMADALKKRIAELDEQRRATENMEERLAVLYDQHTARIAQLEAALREASEPEIPFPDGSGMDVIPSVEAIEAETQAMEGLVDDNAGETPEEEGGLECL